MGKKRISTAAGFLPSTAQESLGLYGNGLGPAYVTRGGPIVGDPGEIPIV